MDRYRSIASALILILGVSFCTFSVKAQSGQPSGAGAQSAAQASAGQEPTGQATTGQGSAKQSQARQTSSSAVMSDDPAAAQRATDQQSGSISGGIVDSSGGVVAAAKVRLALENHAQDREVTSGEDGHFAFANIAPGAFELTVTSAGFASQTIHGTLHPGENYVAPPIALAVASVETEVRVVPSIEEIAEAEIKAEEKQRALGFIPNYYVTYIPDAAPLSPRQKFQLAWKTLIDPVTIAITAGVAGIEQEDNQFGQYGQGAEGYGKRFGAAYADSVTATIIGGALLPSLLKQDPRYFYKGTGSTKSRIGYALKMAVMCKGDNGRWQVNYSYLLGTLAAGGISNAYYPSRDRGAGLTFENAAISVGATAAANLLQEFVIKKLTSNVPGKASRSCCTTWDKPLK
jgi:Carboxypeptidase regulatory-like domain